jgi:UDP-glucose 4-epimerase
VKIALTGGSGRIGHAIAAELLRRGHGVVSVDRAPPADDQKHENLRFVAADIADYEGLVRAFAGCDALIHMAAIPSPMRDPDHIVHNNNVVGSYNALRAAVEHGIMRICQASSVNAIGLSFSRAPHFDYFPIDEEHPNYSEEAYSLSKWICEQQADSFARRYEGIRIASMRFHWVVPDRATAAARFGVADETVAKHLWAYTSYDAAARACLLYTSELPSLELAARFFPGVPIRGDLSGSRSFFSTAKAERLLGWRHDAT